MNRRPQRFGRVTRTRFALALGGVLIVILILLVPVGKPIRNQWGAGSWNLLHLPGFFILARCLLKLLGRVENARRRIFFAAALSLSIGILTEILQGLVGRSTSLEDLILDAVGIALAMLWPLKRMGWTVSRRWVWGAVLVSGIVFAFAPALTNFCLQSHARSRLPAVAGLSQATDLQLWKGQGRAKVKWDKATSSISVQTEPGEAYSGVSFLPGWQDWSNFLEIELSVSNPGKAFVLGFRIDDDHSAEDRIWFSGENEVKEGASFLRIALPKQEVPGMRRPVNLSRVSRLALFVEMNDFPVEFSIKSAVLR